MKIENNTLLILLTLKKELDKNKRVYCNWSATSHNPDIASFTYVNFSRNDFILRGRITDFNPPKLPPISFDDIANLETYIKDNYKTLEKIEKIAVFI
jgi:hypothetical protein